MERFQLICKENPALSASFEAWGQAWQNQGKLIRISAGVYVFRHRSNIMNVWKRAGVYHTALLGTTDTVVTFKNLSQVKSYYRLY